MSTTSKTKTAAPKAATPVDYRADLHLSPGVRDFLRIGNAPGTKPIESLPVPAARQVLVDGQKAFKVDYSGITESEKAISADGFTIKLNIVKPEGAAGTLPVFIFIHGGGWVLGDYPTHRRLVRDLVVASGYAAVFVNYSASPEAQYPQAINEIYAATKWVAANGKEIGVDGGNLAVTGNSVGGNMTGAMGLMAKDKGGPKIKLLVMMWPVTDSSFSQDSYETYAQGLSLTTSEMKWMWDLYTTDPKKRQERYASLLNNTTEDLKGLPPTLIQVAENDILRDEAEAYGRQLEEAGVKVTTVRYNGMVHDWGMLNGLAREEGTTSVVLHAAAEMKHYLG